MSEAIGRRIAEARQKAGLSQTDLGLKTGIAQTQISRYESGRAVPRRAAMGRLAEALGVNFEWLMEGEVTPWPAPITMQVSWEGSSGSPMQLFLPPVYVDFVQGVADRIGGTVPDAIVEIIKRYMVEITFAPTGHPKIPHMGALVTEYTDLELRMKDLEAQIATIRKEAGLTESEEPLPQPVVQPKP